MGGGELETIEGFDFGDETVSSYSWPPRIPRRLKKRLHCKTPCATADQIQAKLRRADLRRQEYYEKLSSKARPKPRSPSRSEEDDLAQRLEAKLQAAAQKRSMMLEKAQTRLARLEELRQAARSGVELRYEREKERLESRVESRIRQAEENRTALLRAHRQRRASLRERSSQTLLRKAARESKYKERVRAAIHQKRAAAEKKRLALLDADRRRARARVTRVIRVAKTVTSQREVERRRMRDRLEDRLQRARRMRAEYLRRRGRLSNEFRIKHGDILSRKLARCWRRFLKKRTTLDLAKAYDARNVNEKSVKSMPFEQVAVLIESPDTLRAVKAVLDRFESRLRVSQALASPSSIAGLDNIDHLLRRVATPKKQATPQRRPLRPREAKKSAAAAIAKNPAPLPRYSVRVSLCAYMILSHPEAVFNGHGEREIALAKSAREFIREFELLLRIVLEGPVNSSDEDSDSVAATEKTKRWTFRTQLEAFDGAWCSYLNCFVVWKDKDAQLLEEDLVRAACQLEFSMMQTCKMSSEGGETSTELTHDMKAVQKQVAEDQRLLREKVLHLSGGAGVQRMESALSETRSKYFLAKENGSPTGSPITVFLSPSPTGPSSDNNKTAEKPSRVVRSLFKEKDGGSQTSGPSSNEVSDESTLGSSVEKFVAENELVVNEYIHNQRGSVTDFFGSAEEEEKNGIKGIIKETMEKAFWDSVMESMRSENPDYGRVVQLVGEVRDELCKMAPGTWTQMIVEAIDLDILSQVLESGNLDIHYLGKIMKFALDTLQKLSSPDSDEEMLTTHQRLMKELTDICEEATDGSSNNSSVVAMVKGLRFVLEQIQVLKQEISKARIRLMEQLLKGPNGLEYLKNAFANRHGSPSNARSTLPLTTQWLSTMSDCADREWEEHTNSLSEITSRDSVPSTALRSGGFFATKHNDATKPKGDPQPECKGEKVDLMVRLGLLKLVSGVSGLTHEALPETFALNLSRLRSVQAQIQKIIVTAVSILICRQTLVSERIAESAKDMEALLSRCVERLTELLNSVEDAGIEEIVESIGWFSEDEYDSQKVAARKVVMAGTLAKSLQAGDPVFERVSRAVQVAARAVVLGGSGPRGRKLAEAVLRPVGAATLTEKLVEVAGVLVATSTVSVGVHGPWYAQIIADDDDM